MPSFPLSLSHQAIVFRAVAVLGLVAALLGLTAGWLLLGRTEDALDASLMLTADTLESLDASAGLAGDTVEILGGSLDRLQETAAALEDSFTDGEQLLGELSGLVRTDVADSLAAVEDTLPGLISVAGSIEGTLATLSSLPFGPSYDPDTSFVESLTELAASLDGLPAQLRDQADLIDDAAVGLGDVGDGVSGLTSELGSFEETLTQSAELLGSYDDTITEGRDVVAQASDDLSSQLFISRLAIVLFSLAFAGVQLVPLHLAAVATEALAADAAGDVANPDDVDDSLDTYDPDSRPDTPHVP